MIQATSLFYAKLRLASTEAIIKDNQFLLVPFYWNSGEDESKAGKPIKQRTMSHGGCGRITPSDYRVRLLERAQHGDG
mgnify:CR=1 FL=1